MIFLAGLTILKKVRCLGRLSGWGVDPVVALRLRNAADYRLPTFGPHGTKLGHSWYQWIIKSDLSGWFDNSKKDVVSGHFERFRVDPTVTLRLRNAAGLPPTYFWVTRDQTREFWISVKNEKWFSRLVWQFWKRRCVWAFWTLAVLIPLLHSDSGKLQTIAYLLLDHMAPN